MARSPQTFISRLAALLIFFFLAGCGSNLSLNPYTIQSEYVSLGVPDGINLNDLVFDEKLNRVLIPGGRTGKLFWIDADNPSEVHAISIFEPESTASEKEGIVSVTSGRGFLFVLNQNKPEIKKVDPDTGTVMESVPVMGTPKSIHFINSINSQDNQIWVTEPDLEQIEVFRFSGQKSALTKGEPIAGATLGGSPGSLLEDKRRGIVYINLPSKGITLALHPETHNLLYSFGNGCTNASGLALDDRTGHMFIACGEGKLVVVDLSKSGAQVTSATYGGELKQVAYNPATGHIYLPSGSSAIMAVFAVANGTPTPVPTSESKATVIPSATSQAHLHPGGEPTPTPSLVTFLHQFGSADTAMHANCITSDTQNTVWLCDPDNGRILMVKDIFDENFGY